MANILAIWLGGGFGALARYGISGLVQARFGASFPAGTLAVNVLGCLFAGAMMGLLEGRPVFAPGTRLFLTVGFLGGFTTFSTFGYETVELLRGGESRLALLSVALNVFLCVGAVVIGRAAALAAGR